MPGPILDLADLGLEYQVISGALHVGGLPEKLLPNHFAGERTRWLANKIQILGTASSIPLLLSELRREGREDEAPEFEQMLSRLIVQPTDPAATREAADRVIELATGRKLAVLLDPASPNNITEKLRTQRVSEAISDLESFLFSEHSMQGVVAEGDVIGSEDQIIAAVEERREQTEFVGVPTFIKPLDDIIDGLLPGEYGLFAGGTGEGKSISLLDVGGRAWDTGGRNVCMFSIEMGKLQQEFRFLAWGCGLEIEKFRRGDLTDAEMDRIKDFFEVRRARENLFYIVDVPENINAAMIEQKLIQVERQKNIKFDLVLVDYMGVMTPIGSFQSRINWDAQGEISWNLHTLARRREVAIWSAVQKKENVSEAVKRKGGVGSIGLSYLIAQAADIVVVLSEKTMEGFIDANIAKGRDVPKDRVKLTPDLRRARLHREQTDPQPDATP